MQELLPLTVASSRLGVHVNTLRMWVRNGTVPAYRVGQRFTRVDWNELLQAIQLAQTPSPVLGQPVLSRLAPRVAASASTARRAAPDVAAVAAEPGFDSRLQEGGAA